MSRRLRHEQRVFLFALLAGLPAVIVSLVLLWVGDFAPRTRWTLALFIGLSWWGFSVAARHGVVYPLQTLANLLEALREGDYSLRGRHSHSDDAFGQVVHEVNTLSSTLHQQRLDAVGATALLATVIEEIDIAVFAFDSEERLRLVNRAGERILARPSEQLADRGARELGFAEWLEGDSHRLVEKAFPGGVGRWDVRRTTFRLEGRPHKMLVITDLSVALRREERQAWRRLIRVLGHELNNSLTPIRSLADTLQTLLAREPRPEDWEEDLDRGLQLIGARSKSLSRFIGAYARLARLPEPSKQPMAAGQWIRRIARLETRIEVEVEAGPALTLEADPDQLEQLLINLVRNAADAVGETGGGVRVRWERKGDFLEVVVEDDGPGLASKDNLFVPFFTTKPGGTGIGLALSQQIAEAHGGVLTLDNRAEASGCEARLRLPL
ncbi:MAG: PAS domain-containing sensor histidine kinase [Deltaproteobacteria bacterium]|nr:PAS domain-containing sensor histidine kinase [Deltaproteobacteria bacterium]